MDECTCDSAIVKRVTTPRAPLAIVGIRIRRMGLFGPIAERVKIPQKTVKYSPIAKLQMALVNILAGAQGTVEINKRVRSDPGLRTAFGCTECAEQSVVQDTLDACTAENVKQMHEAMDDIYRQFSSGYQHDYQHSWQWLDADLTGRPCGRKAALATKGYFGQRRDRHGRQVGYVLATNYQEIVVERVYSGINQLCVVLQPLMEAAERALALDESKRRRTIVRVDAGGGSVDDVNWLLSRGYRVLCKDYSAMRVQKLAQSVRQWVTDPAEPGREVGWVTTPTEELYCQPVRRIAVRCRKKNGQYGIGVILSNLSPEEILSIDDQEPSSMNDPDAALLAYVHQYDQRGGGVETEIKGDKHGLGTIRRNKKRFEAQQMLIQLEALAHNTLIWLKRELAPQCPQIAGYGIKRLVRDVLHMTGTLVLDQANRVVQVILNLHDKLARALAAALASLLVQEQVTISLGET